MNKKFFFTFSLVIINFITTVSVETYAVNRPNNKPEKPESYQIELILFKYNNTDNLFKEKWSFNELKNIEGQNNTNLHTLTYALNNRPDGKVIEFATDSSIQDISPIIINNNQNVNQEITLSQIIDNYNPDRKKDINDSAIQDTSQEISSNYTTQFDNEYNYYSALTDDKFAIKNIANKINNNSRYKLLSHIAWKVPKTDLSNTTVLFKTGQFYKLKNNPQLIPQFDGVITFAQKRYTHADIQLLYSLPISFNNTDADNTKQFKIIDDSENYQNFIRQQRESYTNTEDVSIQNFMISENVRLKNNELTYLDHPAFGAIIYIAPN